MGFRFRRGAATVVTLCLIAQSCLAWHPVPPAERTPGTLPSFVRIVTAAGEELVLQKPVIRGDSISGTVTYPRATQQTFALRDLKALEMGEVDTRKIGWIMIGVGASALIFIGLIAWSMSLDPSHTFTPALQN